MFEFIISQWRTSWDNSTLQRSLLLVREWLASPRVRQTPPRAAAGGTDASVGCSSRSCWTPGSRSARLHHTKSIITTMMIREVRLFSLFKPSFSTHLGAQEADRRVRDVEARALRELRPEWRKQQKQLRQSTFSKASLCAYAVQLTTADCPQTRGTRRSPRSFRTTGSSRSWCRRRRSARMYVERGEFRADNPMKERLRAYRLKLTRLRLSSSESSTYSTKSLDANWRLIRYGALFLRSISQ